MNVCLDVPAELISLHTWKTGPVRRLLTAILLAFGILSVMTPATAQTVTPNESSIVQAAPKKIGINLGGPSFYGAGQIYRNLMWRNPGFEPDLYRDKFVAYADGTTTTFIAPSPYDPVVANFWAGASFSLYRGSPKTLVCSGTLSGNTVATTNAGPTYQFASACSTPVIKGDVIVLRLAESCTPEADWEGNHAGWWFNFNGGAKITSDCVTPYDGVQSLRLDASTSGASATALAHIDTAGYVTGILINGTYKLSGYYKTVGTPVFTISAQRNVQGTAGTPFSCPAQVMPAASAWTNFKINCTGAETNALPAGDITVNFNVTGGVVELDDVSFLQINTADATNTTVFRDEVVAALRKHCAGASLLAVPCELRYWAGQSAEEIYNTVLPINQRRPAVNSFNYDYAGGQGYASENIGLQEFLALCQAVNAEPYYAFPEAETPEDAAKWIEYLNGLATTTYGSKRAASGQALGWLSVFPTIHLAMGNENWNESQAGQGLGYRVDAPDLYYDYSTDAAGIFTSMRASTSWPLGGAGIDLVLGFQDGNAVNGVAEAMTRTAATSGELAPYTQFYVGDTSTPAALWSPLMYEVVANTNNAATTFFQQGSTVKAFGKLNVYEFNNSTIQGPSNLTQSVLDSFTDAAGYGTATALQSLEHLAFGIVDQNFFSLSEYVTGGANNTSVHTWGAFVDMGGATNAVRPQELAMQITNAAIIGAMYACPISSPTTYSLGANHNGMSSSGTPAAAGIAQEYAFCFKNGTQRSMIVINTDIAKSHKLAFSGSQAPGGQVTVTRYDPASISARNEATAALLTNLAPQQVVIDSSFNVSNPTSDTLPPYSVTRYDWTAVTLPTLSLPTTPATATVTALLVPSSTATGGNSFQLTAAVVPAVATGTVTFFDGTTAIGTATLSVGVATYAIPSISTGTHSYTAVYSGSTNFSSSASNATTVTATGVYLQTTFAEYGAGQAINGTAPATGPANSTWSDTNRDWTYQGGGGIIASVSDLSNPLLINAAHSDYTAIIAYPSNAGVIALFRYQDANNYLFTRTFAGEIDLYSRVSGYETTLATIYPSDTTAALTVTLSGTSATISCNGQTAKGTIPASQPTANVVGFRATASNLVISSLQVQP